MGGGFRSRNTPATPAAMTSPPMIEATRTSGTPFALTIFGAEGACISSSGAGAATRATVACSGAARRWGAWTGPGPALAGGGAAACEGGAPAPPGFGTLDCAGAMPGIATPIMVPFGPPGIAAGVEGAGAADGTGAPGAGMNEPPSMVFWKPGFAPPPGAGVSATGGASGVGAL